MLLGVLLAVGVGAAPVSLAMPGLHGVRVDAAELDLYGEVLAARLRERGLKVVTSRDIGAVLGMERQRQLLGCAETSCVAELAGALGVDGLVSGDLAQVDAAWLLTVKVLSAKNGETLAQFDGTAAKAGELRALLGRAAEALVLQLAVKLERPELRPSSAGFSRAWALVPGAVAVAALSVGAWAELRADEKLRELPRQTDAEAARLVAREGTNYELAGHVLLGVGAAAAATSVVLLVLGGDRPPPLTLAPTPNGVAFVGVWP